MSAFRRALVVAPIMLALLLSQCPTAAQAHKLAHTACTKQQKTGDWLAFAYCMGEALHAPGGGGKTRAITACESGGDRWSGRYSNTCCKGLTQQHEDYYQGRVRTFAPLHVQSARWIYSGRWNLVVGIRLAKSKGSWGPDWTWCNAHT